MNLLFKKLFFIVVLPYLLVILSITIAIEIFPLYFFDEEISYYLENYEYSRNKNKICTVLIMGDSTCKADLMPILLSNSTYNFSLGGASPIEEYYYLKEYLKYNLAPQYLLLSFSLDHFLWANTFWTRSVYFHRLKFGDAKKILDDSLLFNESVGIACDSPYLTLLSYYAYLPTRYTGILIGSLNELGHRYERNAEIYKLACRNRGQFYREESDGCSKLNGNTLLEHFRPSDYIDACFRKIIETCKLNKIKLVFIGTPINKTSYEYLRINKPNILKEYSDYLIKLSLEYPFASIDTNLSYMDDKYFSDAAHLNAQGSKVFSLNIKNYILTCLTKD